MIHRLRKLDIMVYLRLKFIAASNTDTFSNPTISGTSDPLYTNKVHHFNLIYTFGHIEAMVSSCLMETLSYLLTVVAILIAKLRSGIL